MRRRVWKYEMPAPGNFSNIEIPAGAIPLAVQMQGSSICLWCEVDPTAAMSLAEFTTVGTGWAIPGGKHVGTVQDGTGFVWHVYQQGLSA